MKVDIEKSVFEGAYLVKIRTYDFDEEELEKISKFGAPRIDLSPQRVKRSGSYSTKVTLNDLDDYFGFIDETAAAVFVDSIKDKIRVAVDELKSKNDSFTKTETLQF